MMIIFTFGFSVLKRIIEEDVEIPGLFILGEGPNWQTKESQILNSAVPFPTHIEREEKDVYNEENERDQEDYGVLKKFVLTVPS